jgi:hypothetical protein
MNVRPTGDRGTLIELSDNDAAVSLSRALAAKPEREDVVPGHRTVLVTGAQRRGSSRLTEDVNENGATSCVTLQPAAAGNRHSG